MKYLFRVVSDLAIRKILSRRTTVGVPGGTLPRGASVFHTIDRLQYKVHKTAQLVEMTVIFRVNGLICDYGNWIDHPEPNKGRKRGNGQGVLSRPLRKLQGKDTKDCIVLKHKEQNLKLKWNHLLLLTVRSHGGQHACRAIDLQDT